MNKFKNENGYMEQDLRGQRFGLLVVIDVVAVSDRREASKCESVCQCGCGNVVPVRNDALKSGKQSSCGCKNTGGRANLAKCNAERTTHGLSGHEFYHTWNCMNRRCYNVNHKDYEFYGAKGVEVYVSWTKQAGPRYFIWFCENHLGPRPEGHTLDRINPAGNYEPGNVRWASDATQAANKRVAS